MQVNLICNILFKICIINVYFYVMFSTQSMRTKSVQLLDRRRDRVVSA